MSSGLLNPQVEAHACKRMIAVTEERVRRLELALTKSVLEREPYLLMIGALQEVRTLLTDLKREYEREFGI